MGRPAGALRCCEAPSSNGNPRVGFLLDMGWPPGWQSSVPQSSLRSPKTNSLPDSHSRAHLLLQRSGALLSTSRHSGAWPHGLGFFHSVIIMCVTREERNAFSDQPVASQLSPNLVTSQLITRAARAYENNFIPPM